MGNGQRIRKRWNVEGGGLAEIRVGGSQRLLTYCEYVGGIGLLIKASGWHDFYITGNRLNMEWYNNDKSSLDIGGKERSE